MTLEDKELESALYIALIPIVINIFVFLMFSRISRLEIPCLHRIIGAQKREILESNLPQQLIGEFVDETPLDPEFDVPEAVKVGVFYGIMLNTFLYFIAIALIRDREASLYLLGTILGLPVLS